MWHSSAWVHRVLSGIRIHRIGAVWSLYGEKGRISFAFLTFIYIIAILRLTFELLALFLFLILLIRW